MPTGVSSAHKPEASPSVSLGSTHCVPLSSPVGRPAPSIRIVIPSTQPTVHVTTSARAVIVGQERALIAVDEVLDGDSEPEKTPDHGHGTYLPLPFSQDAPTPRMLLGVPERAQQRNRFLSASGMVDGLDADADAELQGAGAGVGGLIALSVEEGEGHAREKEAGGHVNRAHTASAGSAVDGAYEELDAFQFLRARSGLH